MLRRLENEKMKEIIPHFINNIKMSIAQMLESIQVASQNQVDSRSNINTELIQTVDFKPVYLSLVL